MKRLVPLLAALSALAEGVVGTEEECDLASVMGAGFPPHTGGAIRFIRGIGIDAFAGRALDLAERHGPRFRIDPAHWEALHRGSKAA